MTNELKKLQAELAAMQADDDSDLEEIVANGKARAERAKVRMTRARLLRDEIIEGIDRDRLELQYRL
jgi:adenylate kinase family enzyme